MHYSFTQFTIEKCQNQRYYKGATKKCIFESSKALGKQTLLNLLFGKGNILL